MTEEKNEQYELTQEDMESLTNTLAIEAEKNPKTQALRKILDGTREEQPTEIKDKEQGFMEFKGETEHPTTPDNVVQMPSNKGFETNLTDEDAMTLYQISCQYKKDDSFRVYEALSDKLKFIVRNQAKMYGLTSKKALEDFARLMVDQLIQEMKVDKEFTSFQEDLQKELSAIDNFNEKCMDMYLDSNKEFMEEKWSKLADSIQEKNPEKAAEIKRIIQAYTDSYTLVKQRELINNNPSVIKQIRKNVIKKYMRFVEHFDFIMSKTQFQINSVDDIVQILTNTFDITDELAMKYVVILCQTCEKLDFHKIEDAWFMYNSVKNIMSLKYVNHSNPAEFSKTLKDNIKELLAFIADEENKDIEV